MKLLSTLAFWCVGLLLVSHSAAAQTATDTVPGQARFVQRLSALLCTRIQESGRTTPFETLTPKQADDLLMRLMLTSMGEQATEFSALTTASRRQKISNEQLGKAVGMDAVRRLSVDCPSSMALFVRTSSAQKELGLKGAKTMNDISSDEKTVLQPLADTICTKLNAENARLPLRQRTAAERTEVMTSLMQTTILKNMSSLLTIYSVEQISNKESMNAFGIKLASLMMNQCPSYIIMLGEDSLKKKR